MGVARFDGTSPRSARGGACAPRARRYAARMNLIYACAAWLGIGGVLGFGLWMFAAKGSPWLLIVAAVGFIVAVGKIGCKTH